MIGMRFQGSNMGRTFLKKAFSACPSPKTSLYALACRFPVSEIDKPKTNMNFLKGVRDKLLCKEVSPEFHFFESTLV
jgi:hypothetical protein